jgi:hypothetical protein
MGTSRFDALHIDFDLDGGAEPGAGCEVGMEKAKR